MATHTVFGTATPAGTQSVNNDLATDGPVIVGNSFSVPAGVPDHASVGARLHVAEENAGPLDGAEVTFWLFLGQDLNPTLALRAATLTISGHGWLSANWPTPQAMTPGANYYVACQLDTGDYLSCPSPGPGEQVSPDGPLRMGPVVGDANRSLYRYDNVGETNTAPTGLWWSLDMIVSDGEAADPPSATVTVAAVNAADGWTASAGTVLTALADGDPATYVTSVEEPTGAVLDVTLAPLVPPSAGQPFEVTLQGLRHTETAASATATVELYNGTTLRATSSPVAIPSAAADAVVTFPASAIGSVDWSAVRCVVTVAAEA